MSYLFGFGHRFGLLDDQKVNEAIEGLTRQLTFADTHIPLHLASTDYNSGEKVVLSEGKLTDAIRASIAIPLVLPPWRRSTAGCCSTAGRRTQCPWTWRRARAATS